MTRVNLGIACLFWEWRLLHARRLELGVLGAGSAGGGWGAVWVPVPEDADGASACHSQVGVMMESPSQESL